MSTVVVHKPHAWEIRQLHAALEQQLSARQQRRAEALLLYATGMEAARIADTLESHVNTIYSDLRAFARAGVGCIQEHLHGGAPRRLSDAQREPRFSNSLRAPPARWAYPTGGGRYRS